MNFAFSHAPNSPFYPTCVPRRTSTCTLSPTDNSKPSSESPSPLFNPPSSPPSTSQIAQGLISNALLEPSDERLFSLLSPSRAALFEKVLTNRTRHITFVLDGVYGAHNLAAIARSCDAWGIQDLHIVAQPEEYRGKRDDGDGENSDRDRSILQRFRQDSSVQHVSKNCHKWLTIREYDNVGGCLDNLRKDGYRIIVSSLDGEAQSIHNLGLSGKCAFVFGNEKHGVTKEMIAQADDFFTVPMMGFVESMNVSVAVGTTACLTVSKSRESLEKDTYFLSSVERRELANIWLKERFSSSGAPRLLRTSHDVTKLGYKRERIVVRQGMFATVNDDSLSPEEYWKLALRLTGEGGRRVATDFIRRKVGVLSDNGFRKRSLAINLFIGGSHALTCEASLAKSGSLTVSRQTLNKYFQRVCENVNDVYAQYFDQFGIPNLPVHAKEFHQSYTDLEVFAPKTCRDVCFEAASDVFGLSAGDVESIVAEAGINDVAKCISDTLRCGERRMLELNDIAKESGTHYAALRVILAQRNPESACAEGKVFLNSVPFRAKQGLPQLHCDVLQLLLRLSNAAMLCSEVYQTIWDRHLHKKGAIRIHLPTFSLLEMLLSDSYSEMVLLDAPHSTALFQGIFEWDKSLHRLKSYFE